MEQEKLVENARVKGELFRRELEAMARKHPVISGVRGRGLFLAFDLTGAEMRNAFWNGAFELGLLVLRCGERSIRLRPVLDITGEDIEAALRLIDKVCRRLPS
jgi:L-lysine 6-transaminase